jgi:hypothetical protein
MRPLSAPSKSPPRFAVPVNEFGDVGVALNHGYFVPGSFSLAKSG